MGRVAFGRIDRLRWSIVKVCAIYIDFHYPLVNIQKTDGKYGDLLETYGKIW